MWRYLPLLATAVAVLLGGVVHGLLTDRWGPSTELGAAVARLDGVPRDVGDWHGEDLELPAKQVQAARIAGSCYRRYENSRSRHVVWVLLVCGTPGPIAIHTPEGSFVGAGYQKLGDVAPFQLPYGGADEEASFRTLRLREGGPTRPAELRLFWSWSTGGPWQAPANPRLTFARQRALYKLYVWRT